MSKRPAWLPRDFSKTYYDSQTLSDDDIMLLIGSNWLNDNMINYYFLYLENEKYKQYSDEFCFMAPSVSFWVSMIEDPEDIKASLEPLNVKNKRLIFIPINDNTNTEATSGGSHWSLVVFDRDTKVFNYYDSSSTYNKYAAMNCVKKMLPYFGEGLGKEPKMVVRKAPQQTNGHDCGVYVLAMTDYLAENGIKQEDDTNICQIITPSSVKKMRLDMLEMLSKTV